MILFTARLGPTGRPNLTRVTIARETPKYYYLEGYEHILGHIYLTWRVRKDDHKWFTGRREAACYLTSEARLRIEELQQQIDATQKWLALEA